MRTEIRTETNVRRCVCDSLRNYIMDNGLTPGTKLPGEIELAKMLGVSRASLREGVRMLEGAGLVTARQGGGLYVSEFDGTLLFDCIRYGIRFGKDDLSSLREVCRGLKLFFAEEAVRNMTEDRLRRLSALCDAMEDCTEPGALFRLVHDFDLTVFEGVENTLAVRLISLYWEAVLDRETPEKAPAESCAEKHRRLVRAFASGETEFVHSCMTVYQYDSGDAEEPA